MQMHRIAPEAATAFATRGWWALAVLLAWSVAVGGSSRGTGPGEVIAQLAAIPMLAWAILALAGTGGGRLPRVPLLAGMAIVAAMALQQLPIPLAWWNAPTARTALGGDLAVAGVDLDAHWSLAPLASERALWSLLPALAVFSGSLVLPAAHLRRLLLLVVALGVASLLLGTVQMLLPRSSALNPFPQWAPAFNGVFENPNHQASLLALCCTIIAALPWGSRDGSRHLRRSAPAWIAMGTLAFLAVPLTGSRAGIGLAVVGVAFALAVRHAHRVAPLSRRGVLLAASVVCATVVAAGAWLQPQVTGSVRWALVEATAAMARDHAPLGAGTGTFTRWFDQSAPSGLVQWEYFNHAHDEYVQWWFELGAAGIACMLAVLVVLVACRPGLAWKGSGERRGVALAGWLGCTLLLLHSLVDYPLRTPGLMAVAALLAGAMCAGRRGWGSTTMEECDER